MKKQNIEVEGGELLIQSKEGHYAVIPSKHRREVMDMVNDGCDDCINAFIQTLPQESDYAEDGGLYTKQPDIDELPSNFKGSKEHPIELDEVEIKAKKQYDYQGCVSGMCNSLAEKNKQNISTFRSLNNMYGDSWEIINNTYGQNVDYSNPANLKENDIVNLTRNEFSFDKKKGIPTSNQHVGYISKIVDGIPYVKHYISNVGVKSDGKTPYGEYFEEPYNDIKEKYKYIVSGAKRLDSYKELDYADSNFKYDVNYEPNQIERDFETLHKEKKELQKILRLTSSEYDELSKIAYGVIGNESSFGRSGKTLYRMAVPDFIQKMVKVGLDIKRSVDVYDENINNLSQGYSSTKESSLYNIAANDGSTDFKTLNKRIKEGDYDGIERTGNYLRTIFNQLGINPDNLDNGGNSGKAVLATLAWYKKRNPNATTEDLLKMYTGKKDITKYKESFDNYQKNINSDPNDNLEYSWIDKLYGKLSNVFNKTYSTHKELNSMIVGTIRDHSPLPVQYNALIADVLQGKTTISEKSLSSSNMDQLKELVKTNVAKGKYTLEYDDYQTAEDKNSDVGGSEKGIESLKKSFMNDAYILKTLLGQATIVKIDDNTYDVIDSFDFNDKGKSFGIFDDLKKRGISPYSIARSVGRNLGSSNNQGQKVKIRIKLN